MKLSEHFSLVHEALKYWFIALLCDALGVGLLWLIGLLFLRVPLAPLWALLAALFQLIPAIGIIFSPVGPAIAAALGGGTTRMFYVLILYAIIVMMDGLLLHPILMKRSARIPMWASIVAPLVLGSLLSFWGVVLSVPLLAVIYAYREHYQRDG